MRARTHKPNIENESLLSMSAAYILNATETMFIVKGNTMNPGPEVLKLFSCSTQLCKKFQLLIKTKMKKFLALSLSDVVFIMLINVQMPTIVCI